MWRRPGHAERQTAWRCAIVYAPVRAGQVMQASKNRSRQFVYVLVLAELLVGSPWPPYVI
jgi:hypothetical protein